jgi:hypothetical protein
MDFSHNLILLFYGRKLFCDGRQKLGTNGSDFMIFYLTPRARFEDGSSGKSQLPFDVSQLGRNPN